MFTQKCSNLTKWFFFQASSKGKDQQSVGGMFQNKKGLLGPLPSSLSAYNDMKGKHVEEQVFYYFIFWGTYHIY